jgi:hypothetical protein
MLLGVMAAVAALIAIEPTAVDEPMLMAIAAYFIFLRVSAQHISEFSNHRQQGRVSANAEGSLKDHGCQ